MDARQVQPEREGRSEGPPVHAGKAAEAAAGEFSDWVKTLGRCADRTNPGHSPVELLAEKTQSLPSTQVTLESRKVDRGRTSESGPGARSIH